MVEHVEAKLPDIFPGETAVAVLSVSEVVLTFCFHPPDAVHTLTCALMLLNTDLHGQVRDERCVNACVWM